MRQSVCDELRTSVLGFGCGSVLGRVGRGASLRAMATAWDVGITLFDTARSYGYGEAEAVLGEFLRGKREQAIVTTKYGISPQKPGMLKRMVVPVARAALQVPGVRGLVRSRGGREVTPGQFSAADLRVSVETSLSELRTDRIDVLFLHEATASAIRQQELMAELDALVKSGKVVRAGLYAAADVIADAMAKGPVTLTAMQYGGDYFDPVVAGFTQNNPPGLLMIANHPFGGEERVARTKAVLTAMSMDEMVPEELRVKLGSIDWPLLLEAILGVVLDGISTHALVFSMMHPDHLRANVQAIENNRFTSAELAMIRGRLLASVSVAGV